MAVMAQKEKITFFAIQKHRLGFITSWTSRLKSNDMCQLCQVAILGRQMMLIQ